MGFEVFGRKKRWTFWRTRRRKSIVPDRPAGWFYFCNMENEIQTIKRVDALREMEIREDQYGKRVLFSVEFYTKEGEVVYLSHAYSCGLRGDMKKNRLRGIQQCDSAGNKIGHVYTVSIDNLRMFNGKKVTL